MNNKTVLGQNILKLLSEHKKRQADLMRYVLEKDKLENKDRANFSRYLNGVNEFPLDYLRKAADFFGTDINTLLNTDFKKPVKTVRIVGTASCGNSDINHLQDLDMIAFYNGASWHKDLYCVIANGDSMAPEIEDGDEVICDPNAKPQNGDLVHYKLFDESAIKVYYRDDEAYILQLIPYNQNENFKIKTIRLDTDEADNIQMSKVVAVNKIKFNNRSARLKLIGR